MTEPIVVAYGFYLALSLALTVWVGRTLFRHGRHFLVDVFDGREDFADAVNRLLIVGFYLVNFGAIAWRLAERPHYGQGGGSDGLGAERFVIELVSTKVGATLVVLGVMHFINLLVLARIRSRGRREKANRVREAAPERAAPLWTPQGGPSSS